MSKRQQQQPALSSPAAAAAAVTAEPLITAPAPSAAVDPPASASAPSAATESTTSSSKRAASTVIEPLPEQSLGCKRARRSPRTFNWMSILALVEVQLVLRCLDIRSRLTGARCNKQLYAAASQRFAWPQDQLFPLPAEEDVAPLQLLGQQVRRSLLRLSAIHVNVRLRDKWHVPPWPGVFAVPNVQAITLRTRTDLRWSHPLPNWILLPLLHYPQAQQLRSLDLFWPWNERLELHQLAALPLLHSLSLGPEAETRLPSKLQQLSLFPSLTHLSLNAPHILREGPSDAHSFCPHLVSLHLFRAVVHAQLVHCLARLPRLQRLQLRGGGVEEHTADAWAAVCSLREIQLDDLPNTARLLPMLGSVPSFLLLRWHCRDPCEASSLHSPSACLPSLDSLRPLMTAAPLLHVELIMPCTIEEWKQIQPMDAISAESWRVGRQRVWDELHQLPSQLPHVRIVAIEQDEDE
jgi:hypothetical protein